MVRGLEVPISGVPETDPRDCGGDQGWYQEGLHVALGELVQLSEGKGGQVCPRTGFGRVMDAIDGREPELALTVLASPVAKCQVWDRKVEGRLWSGLLVVRVMCHESRGVSYPLLSLQGLRGYRFLHLLHLALVSAS